MSDVTAIRRPRDAVLEMVLGCMNYISAEGFEYDYSDLWASPIGRRLKNAAYRTEPWSTMLFGAPILAAEMWLPQNQRWFRLPKRVSPTSVAHRGLTCTELYQVCGREEYLEGAKDDAKLLLELRGSGAHGLSWGFAFDWPTNAGLVPACTPAATQTSYTFDSDRSSRAQTGASPRDHAS